MKATMEMTVKENLKTTIKGAVEEFPWPECRLFYGLEQEEVESVLEDLKYMIKDFKKGDRIVREGEPFGKMGIVLKGMIHIEKTDFWGNRSILGLAEPGQVFGDAYAGMGDVMAEVAVVAASDSQILFVEMEAFLRDGSHSKPFQNRLILNFVQILAEKNFLLTRKVGHVTQRTTRSKLLSFLSEQAMIHGSNHFFIPYDRQQLADYLCVERSAMSKELGKMRDEELITFSKNYFELHQEGKYYG